MGRFLWIGVVLAVILMLYSLVDAIQTPSDRVQSLPKPAWLIIIIVIPVIGAVLWILYGKLGFRNKAANSKAPDDDPNFLFKLDREQEYRNIIQDLEEQLKDIEKEEDDPEDSK